MRAVSDVPMAITVPSTSIRSCHVLPAAQGVDMLRYRSRSFHGNEMRVGHRDVPAVPPASEVADRCPNPSRLLFRVFFVECSLLKQVPEWFGVYCCPSENSRWKL